MATTKITSPDLFDLGSLNTALKLPSGTTAERPTSPSTGEWRYNTTTNLVEFWDGGEWRDLQSEDIPPINSENFNTVIWTGDGTASRAITGVGFKPDWVWYKTRSAANDHNASDSTRGAQFQIRPNRDIAQVNATDQILSFDTDGFTIGSGGDANANGATYVAWCWKANAGTTSSNTDGTVTSTVQANTKAGFSIIKYVGNGVINQSIGHGLNSTPELYITKNLDTGGTGWFTKTTVVDGSLDELALNTSDAASNITNTNLPTSSVIYQYNNTNLGANGQNYIVYAFHSVAGYSKFGSYTGNGAAGNEQNTGFEPAFVLIKRTDSAGAWSLYDNKRSPSNPRDKKLVPNSNAAENNAGTTYQLNFLTNGFNFLGGGSDLNANGGTFLYIAFASDPSAAPVLADSFANALYAGTGLAQTISSAGFKPSFLWNKQTDGTFSNIIHDTLNQPNLLITNSSGALITNGSNTATFTDYGFSLEAGANHTSINNAGSNYVYWAWKANPVPTINTDGTIQSVVSANQAAGFSIIQYTGTGANATIGHGLSAAPELVIVKKTSGVQNWMVGATVVGWTKYLELNTTNAAATASTPWNDTAPTTTTVSLGSSNNGNQSGQTYIMYAFHSVAGFSDIGFWQGGTTTITTGFQPSFVIQQDYGLGGGWGIFDSARSGQVLNANTNAAESSSSFVTFTATGFTVPSESSSVFRLYMAFKENPTPYPLAGNMSFLVVAGGGGGGYWMGAGGGAGGLRTSYGSTSGGGASAESDITLAAGTYTITVGAAGSGMPSGGSTLPSAGNGGDSSIAASGITTITSIAGGGGGAYAILQPSNAVASGANGGSGGGAWSISNQGQSAGTGTAGQGYAGALGGNQTSGYGEGTGGGGGASAAGTQGINGARPNGGDGLAVSITGSSVSYSGGGGGATTCATPNNATNGGLGGTGGGGNGGYCSAGNDNGGNGTTNTGGGGGGSSAVGTPASSGGTAGNGGSGVVILRLLTSEYSSSTTGSPTVTTDGDYTVLTYTGSGTYVHS